MRKPPSTPSPKQQRSTRAFFADHSPEVTGDLHVTKEAGFTTYQLLESVIWSIQSQSWVPLTQQDLSISSEDPELAASEFFARLHNYLYRRFHCRVEVTIRNKYYAN